MCIYIYTYIYVHKCMYIAIPNTNKMHFNIYDILYSIYILTNMFRPVLWPSSGRCYYYKNTVVANWVTVTQ